MLRRGPPRGRWPRVGRRRLGSAPHDVETAVFSRGGHGWEVVPDERRLRPSSAGRPSVNLLPGSASPAGWHASITADAFPLTTELSSTVQGVALQRKNPQNKKDATLEQVAAEPIAGPAVVSVWARSANGDQLLIRVRARHAGSPHSLGGGDRFFRLTPSFERYWVQLGDVAAEQPPAVVLGMPTSATASSRRRLASSCGPAAGAGLGAAQPVRSKPGPAAGRPACAGALWCPPPRHRGDRLRLRAAGRRRSWAWRHRGEQPAAVRRT
jgi:hypothetical protein